MPALITCPACGFKVQMVETLLGRRVRCQGCEHRFIAGVDLPVPARSTMPVPAPVAPAPFPSMVEGRSPGTFPLCPNCRLPVGWEVNRCRYCNEELEPTDGQDNLDSLPLPNRRDLAPHRGTMLTTLSNISLVIAALAFCFLGVPVLFSLPLGIAAWVMADGDLEEMAAGRMDLEGRRSTQYARSSAIVAVVVSLLLAGFVGLFGLIRR